MADREITYHRQMLDDLTWWLEHDRELGAHVVELIEETQETPEEGRGRPKRLHSLNGVWSRRINRHYRLIYRITPDEIRFLSCRAHKLAQPIMDGIVNGEDV